MEPISIGFIITLCAKLGIGIGSVTGLAFGVNWFNKKNMNTPKRGGIYNDDIEFRSTRH